MEEIITIFIYIHAFFGGLGLISGIGSILVKKGSKPHKKLGKFFSISMISSSLISMPIACMPNHENNFLFVIGLFTIYLVISGNQILTFKQKEKNTAKLLERITSGSMLIISICMVIYGILGMLQNKSNSILYIFFGGFGLSLTIRDFIYFKNLAKKKNLWLSNHIGKMVGALIASITAFIVAGIGIGNIFAWITPSILGTFYIIYWRSKIKL